MKNKILKKISAVLLLSVVLITAVVVPCFAWEWNSSYQRFYAQPVLEMDYVGVARSIPDPTVVLNQFTTNGAFNFLYNTNGNTGLIDREIVNFPLNPDTGNVKPQGDSTDNYLSQLGCVSIDTPYGQETDISRNIKENFLKYALFADRLSPYYNTWSGNYDHATSYRQFSGAYAPNIMRSTYTYKNGQQRYFVSYADECVTYYDFLDMLSFDTYSYYLPETTDVENLYLHDLLTFSGTVAYKNTSGETITAELSEYNPMVNIYELGDAFGIENAYQLSGGLGFVVKQCITDVDTRYPIRLSNVLYYNTQPAFSYTQQRLSAVYDASTDLGRINKLARSSSAVDYNAYSDVYISEIPAEIGNVTNFLSTAIGGFMDFSLIPGITLGGVLVTILCVLLLITFLKIFAGG